MKARIFFAWYDMWIGAYWNRENKVLYICLLPMIVIAIYHFKSKQEGHEL